MTDQTTTSGQTDDRIIKILNQVVQYSTAGSFTISAVAAMVYSAVNTIADAIGAQRVTLAEVITAFETQLDRTDATIDANITRLRQELIG
jgi:hypothetical protein